MYVYIYTHISVYIYIYIYNSEGKQAAGARAEFLRARAVAGRVSRGCRARDALRAARGEDAGALHVHPALDVLDVAHQGLAAGGL